MATERVKPIVLKFSDDEGNVTDEYTLEFNRETIKFAEARKFDIDDVSKYPMTKIPELFWYAFRWHHPSMSKAQTDKIFFENLGGFEGVPDGFGARLGELYNAPFTASFDGEKTVKNPKWTVEL